MSSRYREDWGIEFYAFEGLSNDYHFVLYDRWGKVSDFLKDLTAVVGPELNSIRATSGSFFEGEPGIQTVLGDERVTEHCVYVLANAVAAGIVHKTAHCKGSCECVSAVSSDESRLEVRLTAIRPENNIEPMPPLPFLQNDSPHSGLVMSAASQRLAIALRTDHGTLRALLVEP